MIPEIEYRRPSTVKEALEYLKDSQGQVKLIAGGTDIIPGIQQNSKRFSDIKILIDTKSINDLKKIEFEGNELTIGSACTFSDILSNPMIKDKYPLLIKAASSLGSVQIRNLATITGNFVNNAPCADSVPPLLVYDAKIKIESLDEQRITALEDFLVKPYTNQLETHEMITEIILPSPPEKMKGDFYKLGRRRAVSISRITLAVLVQMENETIEELRIASGAITPIGKRFYELENYIKNKPVTADFLKMIAQQLGEQILQATGLRWSSPYKLPVVQQLFYQILTDLCLCREGQK
ncbi:FAD binding domain-containing protein [Calditrichota bacterium]